VKTLQIHEDLVALHRTQHRTLRLDATATGFGFARECNSLLLAASELPQAALDFPCVFISAEGGHCLAALTGLRERENLFVQADGHWAHGSYVPAFLRRYPFVLAETAGDPSLTVCFDHAHPGLNTERGEALFDADGHESPWLQEVMRFLVAIRQEMTASQAFAHQVAALGLLDEGLIRYTLDGKESSLHGFHTVNEGKLRALPPQILQELASKGWLGLIHAHLLSLNQVQRLALRLDERQARDRAAAQAQAAAG
jgi:hypothetical protein